MEFKQPEDGEELHSCHRNKVEQERQIRRLESYVGARPSFPILTFQRPEAKFTDFNALAPPQI